MQVRRSIYYQGWALAWARAGRGVSTLAQQSPIAKIFGTGLYSSLLALSCASFVLCGTCARAFTPLTAKDSERCTTLVHHKLTRHVCITSAGLLGPCSSLGCTSTCNRSSTAIRPRAVFANGSEVVKSVGPTPVLLHMQKTDAAFMHCT